MPEKKKRKPRRLTYPYPEALEKRIRELAETLKEDRVTVATMREIVNAEIDTILSGFALGQAVLDWLQTPDREREARWKDAGLPVGGGD